MENLTYLKKFARYASLSVLGTLGVSCYVLADTYFIAKGLGTDGLASLNIALPIFNLIYGIGFMFGIGGATMFSICKSGKNVSKLNPIYSNAVYMAIFFSAIFVFLGLFCSKPFAAVLGADESILGMTDIYLKTVLLFAPAFIMNQIFLCFVRNDEAPFLATCAMLIGNFSNIILDYVFIFPMKMGIFGAAFATGISPIISIMIMSLHWIRRKNNFHFKRVKFDSDIIKQNISLGFPSLIQEIAAGIVIVVFNMLILNLEGNVGVAAYGVIANVSIVIGCIYRGIASGAQPLISESYGRSDKEHVDLTLHYSMVTMIVVSSLVYAFIFFFADGITSLFNSEKDMIMQEISVTGLKLYFSSVLFLGYNTIISTYFTSVNNAKPAHVLSLLRGIFLIIPLAFLLSAIWKMTGIWMTFPVTEGIVAILGFIIYERDRKKSAE